VGQQLLSSPTRRSSDLSRHPGIQRPLAVLQSEIQLGGLFRVKLLEGIGTTREQLPVVREALGVAKADIGCCRKRLQIVLVTQERSEEHTSELQSLENLV